MTLRDSHADSLDARKPWHWPQVTELDEDDAREIRKSLERDTVIDEFADCGRVLKLYHDVASESDGIFVLTTIGEKGKAHAQRFAIGDAEGMASEAVARGQTANVYFGPAVYSKELQAGRRGKAKDVVAVLGVVLDDDGDTGKRASLPPNFEPSITITTSSQPCINRQHHFVFDQPVLPADARTLAELICRKCGGDHGGKDIAHVWRLPQTRNHPSAAKIKRGRPCEPQRVEVSGGSFETFDPDVLRCTLERLPDLRPQRRTDRNKVGHACTGGSTNATEIRASLPAGLADLVDTEPETDRSGHCFHTVQNLMEHGLTEDEVRLLAESGSFANKFLERGDLDDEIARARAKWNGEARRQRAFARQTPLDPQSNTPIDGDALLSRIYDFLGRFIAYPSDHARVAHTLWIAHTHMMDAWDSTPRLAFLSKEPGSGKTRGLEISELLVPRPVEAVNVSPAYLFRKVADDAGRPTILFDEIDTVFGPKAKDNEEIRGLLNAGHRKGAVAGRCVVRGTRVETEEISAYCAVAIAGLGNLPDTILSRAVTVQMRRRAPDEKVEPYRRRLHKKEGEELKERLALWAANVKDDVIANWPEMPPGVDDRDADVWEALVAVADQAGGEWPRRAREAAVTLVALSKESSPSLGIQLLSDLRKIFGDADAMGTEAILTKLNALEEAHWGDLKGKPLDSRALARMLKPYGVTPKPIRTGSGRNDVYRGYKREELHDPWVRYLPPPDKSVTSVTDVTNVPGEAS